MAPLGEGPSSALDDSFGALFLGAFFAAFLQGLLTLQAWLYYERFPYDTRKLKLFVLFIWVLDTTQLAIMCQTVYHYLVTNWGFQPALKQSTIELMIHIPLVGLSCLTCQLFLIHRIWVFSGRNFYIVIAVTLPCLIFAAMNFCFPIRTLVMHYTIPQFTLEGWEITLTFVSGGIGDVLISGMLCYYLRLSSRGAFKTTRIITSDILHYVVVTGTLTSLCQVGALIAYFVNPSGLYYAAIHLSLGRLYTNSCLATLNSRTKLRDKLEQREALVPSMLGENNAASMLRKPMNVIDIAHLNMRSHEMMPDLEFNKAMDRMGQSHSDGVQVTIDTHAV